MSTTFSLKSCRSILVLLLAWLTLTVSSVQARTLLELDESKQPVSLADWGDYWIEDGGQLRAEQVEARTELPWKPTLERGIYPLKPNQTLWIRFTIPPAPDSEHWRLEIPYPALDRVSLFSQNKVEEFVEQVAGDRIAVNQWSAPHRHTALRVAFNAEEPTRYLLRLQNAQGFSAPVQFVSERYLLRGEQLIAIFYGAYFGVAVLGFVMGLVGIAWLRDRAYAYYAVSSLFMGLTLAAMTGVGGLYLWPNSPNWADRSLTILGTLTMVAFTLLNATVVSLADRSRRLNLLVTAAALLGVVLAIALGVTSTELRLMIAVPYLLLSIAVVLCVNLWAWRLGDRFSGWLLLAATPFVASWALSIARYLEWLPLSVVTEHSGLASMSILLAAMLGVLVLRSQHLRENRRRMSGVDRIDPTTGLITQQLFTERLLRMYARAERLNQQSVVLLIDVTNADQVQRDYGRRMANLLLLRVAARLLATVRDIDSVASLSEQRFGMLIEGPITAEVAATLGPRIITRCLMQFNGLPTECVAQVRLAYSLVPSQDADRQSVLSRLDDRLARATTKSDKRAIFSV